MDDFEKLARMTDKRDDRPLTPGQQNILDKLAAPSPQQQGAEPASKMPLALRLRVLADHIKTNNGLRDNQSRDHLTLIEAADALESEQQGAEPVAVVLNCVPESAEDYLRKQGGAASKDWIRGWNDCRERAHQEWLSAQASPSEGAAEPSAKQGLTDAQMAVLGFLWGAGPLRGDLWFGEQAADGGKYWWRRELIEAFPSLLEAEIEGKR